MAHGGNVGLHPTMVLTFLLLPDEFYMWKQCHVVVRGVPVADPGWGFGDVSLVNKFHLTSIIFSVVSK